MLHGRELLKCMVVRKFRFKTIEDYLYYQKAFMSEQAYTLPATVNEDGSIDIIICDQYNKSTVIQFHELLEPFDNGVKTISEYHQIVDEIIHAMKSNEFPEYQSDEVWDILHNHHLI